MDSDRPKRVHARMYKKVCPVCGVDFMGRKNQTYCSRECWKEYQKRCNNKKPHTYDKQKAAERSRAFREEVGKQAKIAVAALSDTERLELSYAFLSIYEGQKLYFCGAHSEWKRRCKRVRDEDGRLYNTCSVCGKAFVAPPKSKGRFVYCSPECKQKADVMAHGGSMSQFSYNDAQRAVMHLAPRQRMRLAAMLAEVG